MGIRALCAAAAVVMGVGSAADAATYHGSFTLVSARVESDFDVGSGDPDPPGYSLPGQWGVATGDTVAATITITEEIGGMFFSLVHEAGEIFYGEIRRSGTGYSGRQSMGPDDVYPGWKKLTWDGEGSGSITFDAEAWPQYYKINSTFTFDPASTAAPVPLPATAALLPLGIGALALMRRRRGAQTV